MKKLLITIVAIFLPMLAMGQLLYENDFTGISSFNYWAQFDDSQTDGKIEVDPDGVAITVGIQTGHLWQPRVMVVPDGSFNLEKGSKYTVVVTAKFPTSGTLQINMGSWTYNDQAQFPVTATGDFQEVVCEFPDWSVDAEDAHLLFECGDFKGTTILKKIEIWKDDLPYNTRIYYNYIEKGRVAEVIQNPNGYKRNIIIPEKVTHEGVEYTVTKIADNAFSGCSGLSSVTIPNSVTSIGNYAFNGCSGLSSVMIPNSVTSIGGCAFFACSSLTSVSIPNSMSTISYDTFAKCTSLTSITIPNSVSSIGSSAFAYCSGLTSITIPNSVTSISDNAFKSCSGLTSITIPNSVTYIGGKAFESCSGLKSVTIGSGIRSIGINAFANCTNLEDVYCMAELLYSIGNYEGLQTDNSAFDGSYVDYATLHVPASAINAYKTTTPWSGFGEIVSGEEMPKCATPTISFENGMIKFSCETEGVEYVSKLSTDDTGDKYTNEIILTGKITVKVYATKSGFVNSDTTTAEFSATGVFGDLNGDGKVNVADHVKLSEIIMDQNE